MFSEVLHQEFQPIQFMIVIRVMFSEVLHQELVVIHVGQVHVLLLHLLLDVLSFLLKVKVQVVFGLVGGNSRSMSSRWGRVARGFMELNVICWIRNSRGELRGYYCYKERSY